MGENPYILLVNCMLATSLWGEQHRDLFHAAAVDGRVGRRQEILDHMEDNLCRCGAHVRIVQAIETVAAEMRKGVRS